MIAAILLADKDHVHEGDPMALMRSDSDESLLEWQIGELRSAGADVVEVVLGAEAERLIPLASGEDIEPIVNDRWPEGEAASVRVGATATPRNTATAVLMRISQPREAAVIEAVLREHTSAGATVTRPMVGDVAERPVAVNASVLARLRNLADGEDIEDVLRDYDTLVVRVAGPLPDLLRTH